LVVTLRVAEDWPAGIRKLEGAGTSAGFELEKLINTPADGAGPARLTWRETVSPGCTVAVGMLREMMGSAAALGVTFKAAAREFIEVWAANVTGAAEVRK
jgi:hypothetical protein